MVSKLKYNISNKKTRIILDELGEEYKNLLIEKTMEDSRAIDLDDIDLSELIKHDINAKKMLKTTKIDTRRRKTNSLISLMGITYSLFGVLTLLLNYVSPGEFGIFKPEISILLIFMGLFIVLLSMYFMIFMSKKSYSKRTKDISLFEVVNKWKELEALMVQLTPEDNQFGFRSAIDYLSENNMISHTEHNQIMELLQLRNKIVHEQEENLDISSKELRSVITTADSLIRKLSKLI